MLMLRIVLRLIAYVRLKINLHFSFSLAKTLWDAAFLYRLFRPNFAPLLVEQAVEPGPSMFLTKSSKFRQSV